MGHIIQGFIGSIGSIQKIVSSIGIEHVAIEELPQNMQLLYLSDEIFNAISELKGTISSEKVHPFDFFDSRIKTFLERVKPNGDVAYIETEYFGGVGAQVAALIRDGKVVESFFSNGDKINVSMPYPERLIEEPINKVLKAIGVISNPDLDAFDSLGLGGYRHMPDNEI